MQERFSNVLPDWGNLNKFVLATDETINTLLIGAYSMLDGVSAGFQTCICRHLWLGVGFFKLALTASVRGLEANIGSDAGMGRVILNRFKHILKHHCILIWTSRWREVYEAVSRCNSVIPGYKPGIGLGHYHPRQC